MNVIGESVHSPTELLCGCEREATGQANAAAAVWRVRDTHVVQTSRFNHVIEILCVHVYLNMQNDGARRDIRTCMCATVSEVEL
jgi:hypothetical protein